MTTPVSYAPSPSPSNTDTERYLSVEDVARRLGIPADLVLRRVVAGDVPARRITLASGATTYELRLSDLGLAPDEQDTTVAGVIEVTGTVTVPVAADIDVEAMVPPPSRRERQLTVIGDDFAGPLSDIAGMAAIDPRQLVAGLLDRWERTLEQRIYAEQRQRFESELVARQTMVRELQMELRTARAEHAAAQAEKDRALAARDHAMVDRERALANAERELDQSRRAAQQAQIQLQAQQTRKRGWLFRR